MKYITLACAAGMSTSALVKRMQDAAREQGIDANIQARPVDDVVKDLGNADVLLLGPQVRYRLKELQGICSPKGVPVAVINSVDYGMMNGKKVLETALDLLK
ncbi:PTS sugar transporter subunit IIB [Olsenella sp. AGMB03486]|jgi:PTS system cellobiose-specific IIB component|uniref:PTS sugar transporter subunit IIB n=1 Tax=Olsenella sp. AGMB03486 TaxID=3230364 RepID=UPI0034A0787E